MGLRPVPNVGEEVQALIDEPAEQDHLTRLRNQVPID